MVGKKIINFCKDFIHIENYEEAYFDDEIWHCHHRLETHNSDGERRAVFITPEELKALDMYFNRPAEELIFMLREDHISLHHNGLKMTDEQKKKLSDACKGREGHNKKTPWEVYTEYAEYLLHYNRPRVYVAWNKGIPIGEETKTKIKDWFKTHDIDKSYMQTEEYRKALSDGQKRRYAEGKTSRGSRGMHWFNNGTINVSAFECPEGFVKGRLPCSHKIIRKPLSEESKKRISNSLKGKHLSEECKAKLSLNSKGRKWYNNGEISVMRFECPDGFVLGRLVQKKK